MLSAEEGKTTTPLFDGRFKLRRSASNRDLFEQIRQLESEGSRLLTATNTLGETLFTGSPGRPLSSSRGMASSLSALADITKEEKTLSDLRHQLDVQSQETERLLSHPRPGGMASPMRTSALSKLEIPTSEYYPTSRQPTPKYERHSDYLARDALRDTEDLRQRLRESLDTADQQRSQFRKNLEELKSKLQSAEFERDNAMGIRNRERQDGESRIGRLQATVDQLEQANRLQEETLLDMNLKMEGQQKHSYTMETAFNQLRSIVMSREAKRPSMFFEGETGINQAPGMVVHSLERFIQDLEVNSNAKDHKMHELHSEVDTLRHTLELTRNSLEKDYNERLDQMAKDHQKELNSMNERSVVARSQASNFQEQINMIQRQAEQQIIMKEETIKDLEKKLLSTNHEIEDEKVFLKGKNKALEATLDEVQKEMITLKSERDEALQKSAAVETRFNDMQSTIEKLRCQIDEDREKVFRAKEQDTDNARKLEHAMQQLQEKNGHIERLEQTLTQVRKECDAQLQKAILTLEKEGVEKNAELISSLSSQVSSLTEKYHKVVLDLELAKEKAKTNQGMVQVLTTDKEELTKQVEKYRSEGEHLKNLLKDRTGDLERLCQERDYYFRVLDERNEELASVKRDKERLGIQLQERQQSFEAMKEQNENMSQIVELNSATSKHLKEEKDNFAQQLNEKIIECEEIRHLRDDLSKKCEALDKRCNDLTQKDGKVDEQIKDLQQKYNNASEKKETLFNELKASRYEVARISEEREKLLKKLEESKSKMSKEMSRVHAKLVATETDHHKLKDALKAHHSMDDRAVKVAGKMQKEVTEKRSQIDTLQSKLRWFEECLDSAFKDKKALIEENESFQAKLDEENASHQKSCLELEGMSQRNKELRNKISKMEGALEKAAVRYAAAQAKVEEYEQELTRLRLKHQLEIKELERSGRITKCNHSPSEMAKAILGPQKLTTEPKPFKVTSHGDDIPVSQKPIPGKHYTSAESGNQEEMKVLMHEMRNLISAQKNERKRNEKKRERYAPSHISTAQEETFSEHFQMSETETDNSSCESVPQKHWPSKKKHPRKGSSGSIYTPTLASSAKRKMRPKPSREFKNRSKPGSVPRSPRAPSPVSSLLGLQEFSDSKESLDQDNQSYTTETQELCKKLGKRIESLSKMGGTLAKENKECAKLIKDQDKKLKKVKETVKGHSRK